MANDLATMPEFCLKIFSHHFSVTRLTPRGRAVVEGFARRYVQYGLTYNRGGRYTRTALKVYAAASEDRNEFRFHINQLKEFREALAFNYIRDTAFVEERVPIPEAEKVDLVVKPKWQPRDGQDLVIEHGVSEGFQKLVELQTGKVRPRA